MKRTCDAVGAVCFVRLFFTASRELASVGRPDRVGRSGGGNGKENTAIIAQTACPQRKDGPAGASFDKLVIDFLSATALTPFDLRRT